MGGLHIMFCANYADCQKWRLVRLRKRWVCSDIRMIFPTLGLFNRVPLICFRSKNLNGLEKYRDKDTRKEQYVNVNQLK